MSSASLRPSPSPKVSRYEKVSLPPAYNPSMPYPKPVIVVSQASEASSSNGSSHTDDNAGSPDQRTTNLKSRISISRLTPPDLSKDSDDVDANSGIASNPPMPSQPTSFKKKQTRAASSKLPSYFRQILRIDALATILEETLPGDKPDFIPDRIWNILLQKKFTCINKYSPDKRVVEIKIPEIYDALIHTFFAEDRTSKSTFKNQNTRWRWWTDDQLRVIRVENKQVKELGWTMKKITLPNVIVNNPQFQEALKKNKGFFKQELASIFRAIVEEFGDSYLKKRNGERGYKNYLLDLPDGVADFETLIKCALEKRKILPASAASELPPISSSVSSTSATEEDNPFEFDSSEEEGPPSLG